MASLVPNKSVGVDSYQFFQWNLQNEIQCQKLDHTVWHHWGNHNHEMNSCMVLFEHKNNVLEPEKYEIK